MKKVLSLLGLLMLIITSSFADTVSTYVADSIAIQNAVKAAAEAAAKQAINNLPPTVSPLAGMLVPVLLVLLSLVTGWLIRHFKPTKKADEKSSK